MPPVNPRAARGGQGLQGAGLQPTRGTVNGDTVRWKWQGCEIDFDETPVCPVLFLFLPARPESLSNSPSDRVGSLAWCGVEIPV